jgi:integrase
MEVKMKRRPRGSGTIEKIRQRDGSIAYRARLPDGTGKREPLGVYPTELAADQALHAARVRGAQSVKESGILVRDWGQRFLDQREADRLRGTKKERSRWRVAIDGSPLADLPMASVTRADAKAWVRWLSARRIKMRVKSHPSNGKRMQRQGMQNALNLVRKAFEEALDDIGIKVNPFAGVKLPKAEGRTHDPWTYLLPEEQTTLLDSLQDQPKHWALVAFAMFTGMRQAEIYSLRWEDVTSTTITVRYGAQNLPTKSGKHRRIPILDKAQEALEIARGKRQSPRGLVFPNRLGTRRYEGEPSWWKDELSWAGLDPERRHDKRGVRFHDLRHTAGTSLANGWWGRTWLLQEVQHFLGHAALATTERYAHITPAKLLEAAADTHYTPTFVAAKEAAKLPAAKAQHKPDSSADGEDGK